ncbi:MAG: hypothetical protein JXA10_00395 [Anaerolineae bacterium]|nr:hypothetical protein [Anaerolineae bacterium]
MFTRITLFLTLLLLICAGCSSDTAKNPNTDAQQQAATAAILAQTPSDTPRPTATATLT